MCDIFKNCYIYLCKANLSQTRYHLFESKIKSCLGKIINDTTNNELTHIVVEDSLCENNTFYNILLKNGFNHGALKRVIIVKADWICQCLKHKLSLNITPYLIKLPLLINNETKIDQKVIDNDISYFGFNDITQPEAKRLKTNALEESSYLCSQVSNNEVTASSNHLIIEELEKLSNAFKNQGDKWRSYGYEKAVRAIKNYSKEITSYEEAITIPGIGEKMALKIKEILLEGGLRKVDEICGDERNKTLELFSGVWGAGPTTVQAWFRKGYKTLDDLQNKAILTNQQKIGLKYYEEIQEKFPRSEVEKISEVIKQKALSIDNSLEVVVCGSYRRGKSMCGDVDIVIIKPDKCGSQDILFKLHKELKKDGIITDDLTNLEPDLNNKKYLGLCKLPGEQNKHRRLDIFIAYEIESACAIMHYTGSAMFNRSIRLLANHKGLCLSEHALSTDSVKKGNEVKNAGTILFTPTEESIFEHLGLEYRTPEQRDH